MLAIALTDIRLFLKYAYLFYAGSLILLIAVEVAGTVAWARKDGSTSRSFIYSPRN